MPPADPGMGSVGFLEEQGHIVSNPDTLNMDLIGMEAAQASRPSRGWLWINRCSKAGCG